MRVKVCGMTELDQVRELDEMGVEFCGFIFYPKSPRYIFKRVPSTEIKKIKGKINKVGVFVNADPEEVLRVVDDCGLYLVQLHGDESPRVCEKISSYITTIKAFRLSNEDNILWKIREYYDAVDMFLFDTDGIGYGGTGIKFDWNRLKGLNINKPFFLSGGISPDDYDKILDLRQDVVGKDLFSVDINSRFEISPVIKDIKLVNSFVNSIKKI